VASRPRISWLRWDSSDWIETGCAALPAWIGRRSTGRTDGFRQSSLSRFSGQLIADQRGEAEISAAKMLLIDAIVRASLKSRMVHSYLATIERPWCDRRSVRGLVVVGRWGVLGGLGEGEAVRQPGGAIAPRQARC
jgi:hypothetical protein